DAGEFGLLRARKLLSDDDYEELLARLDAFLSKQKDKDKNFAVEWFCEQYDSRYVERETAIEAKRLNNERVSANLFSLLWGGFCTFLGLMGFIIFPLLVRIEANTRPTTRATAVS
ncbi:MAG TPA: hypothetical protein VGM76_15005, partial [Lacipirellulaceae bacterium]